MCGVIDCDLLDTPCLDYADLTADRCGGFGRCKAPNDTAETCKTFTSLCSGDGGSRREGGAAGDGTARQDSGMDSGGCGCSAGRLPVEGTTSRALCLAALVLILGLARLVTRARRGRRRS